MRHGGIRLSADGTEKKAERIEKKKKKKKKAESSGPTKKKFF